MRFKSPHQHSLGQYLLIKLLARETILTPAEAMFLLAQLAAQGLDEFETVYANVFTLLKRSSQKEFAKARKEEWLSIRRSSNFKKNLSNNKLIKELYSVDKIHFFRGKVKPENLLICFTTMFNNFHMSNIAFLSFIQEFGISLLILKDSSIFNYLNGIPGFGTNFLDSIENLHEFIQKEEFENVFISGFSSSGYASLLSSCLLPCDGYLGFSVISDLSAGSSIVPGKYFTERARASIQPELLKNLADPVAANLKTHYQIYYGSLSYMDTTHAANLRNCGNVDVNVLPGAGHLVLSPLLISGQLTREFRSLILAG